MRRVLLGSALSVCACLLAVSLWLAINPRTAAAAEGSANCGGGWKLMCCMDCSNVKKCDCTDGVGCTVTYNDNTTSEKKCSSFGGPAMEEGNV